MASQRQLILSTMSSLMSFVDFQTLSNSLYNFKQRMVSDRVLEQYTGLDKSNSCHTLTNNVSKKLIISGYLSRLAEKGYLDEISF